MSAPTNISFATAIDVGSTFPYSNTQRIDDSGTYYTVYYKIAATKDEVLGFFFLGDLTNYTAEINVYISDQTTIYLNLATIDNLAFFMPLSNGAVYYFEIVAAGPLTTTPANLNVSVVVPPNISGALGDFLIPDDTTGFPAQVINHTNGATQNFALGFPVTEFGVALSNGYIGVLDEADNKLKIFNSGLILTTTVDPYPGKSLALNGCIGSNKTDHFYVGLVNDGAGHARVKRIKYDGTIETPEIVLPAIGLTGLDANNGDTIMYYTGQTTSLNAPVKRWNVTTNAALSDLAAGQATFFSGEIKVLADGTILVTYSKTSVVNVLHYDLSGTVLNTYSFGASNAGSSMRIDVGIDNPTSFWTFRHPASPSVNRYTNIKVSDGSIISDFQVTSFEGGVNQGSPATLPTRYSAATSCPIIVLQVPETIALFGTIVVNKVITTAGIPSVPFSIAITGSGITPIDFNLSGGQSQTFPNIPVGSGYSITETTPSGWVVSYVVNTGESNTNFSVANGQTTTITVNNTPVVKGGMYQLNYNSQKTNDTAYIGSGTADIAIPNPKFRLAGIGG